MMTDFCAVDRRFLATAYVPLVDFDRAARQTPFADERLVRAPHEQHAVAIDHDRPDADDRLGGIFSHSPITLLATMAAISTVIARARHRH